MAVPPLASMFEFGAVVDIAAIDRDRAYGASTRHRRRQPMSPTLDRIPAVTAGVDLADDDNAAVRAGVGAATVSGRRDVAAEAPRPPRP